MQSLEKDVQCTLINRMLLFEELPEDIKKIIPDKRLFVLGYAPPKVKQKIVAYCNSLPDYTEKCETADKERNQILRHLTVGWQIRLKKLYSLPQFFDGEPIQSVTRENNKIRIQLQSSGSLLLKDAAIIEMEKDMSGSFVYVFELHKVKEQYEIHLLLYRYNEKLIKELFYATFAFKDMRFE